MGIDHRLETSPDPSAIAQDAASGNPVIISTPQHYYFADAYDTRTGRLHVGVSGTNRKGGAEWMSVHEIKNLDGGINGALFSSSPTSVNKTPNNPALRAQLGPEAARLTEESLGITAQSKR